MKKKYSLLLLILLLNFCGAEDSESTQSTQIEVSNVDSNVEEPNIENTISILRGLKEKYELHHGITISDKAIVAAAELSSRYINERFLPDKAIDLIDEAGSKKSKELERRKDFKPYKGIKEKGF